MCETPLARNVKTGDRGKRVKKKGKDTYHESIVA
jgi:hypothetical protein